MIEFHLGGHPADAFSISITVISVDGSGAGIRKITVKDQFGALIRDQGFDCPHDATLTLDPIETFRFPISVEGMDCRNVVTPPMSFPLVSSPTDPKPIPIPCSAVFCPDDPVCLEANAVSLRLRNEVLERCAEAAALRSRRDALAAAALAAFALAAALAAAAGPAASIPFIGHAVAAILLLLAAAALFTAIALAIAAAFAERDLERANNRLQNARDAFTEAADNTFRACCRYCISGDLTQPACP